MNLLPWHTSQWQQLMTATNSGRLHHALMLEGTKGIGLTHFATLLARTLLCEHEPAEQACGQCHGCQLSTSGNHPDIFILEPEEEGKQIKVEAVRELIGFIQLKSHSDKFKIAIIEPADAMNRSAANALLKTLEEPPEQSLLILNTHQPQRLPVTIRSRCQHISFNQPVNDAMKTWLDEQLTSEHDSTVLLRLAGAPLAALTMVEQEQIEQRDRLLDDLEDLQRQNGDPVSLGKAWSDLGATQVLIWLQALFLDMLKLKISDNAADIKNIDLTDRLRQLLNGLDLAQLLSCSQLLARMYAQQNSTISFNSQTLLEEFLFFWQSIKTSGGVAQ